jgi:hypothetical protein
MYNLENQLMADPVFGKSLQTATINGRCVIHHVDGISHQFHSVIISVFPFQAPNSSLVERIVSTP